MSQALPYLLIDDDFSLNYSLLALILQRLGQSSKNNAVLDFEKLQIFLYLTKNPSKINSILTLAGKKFAPISTQYTYTIESLSTNVDMLFDRAKLKILLKELAARGMISCEFDSKTRTLKYLLSENGKLFAEEICDQIIDAPESYLETYQPLNHSYFNASLEVIDSLSPLQTQPNSKLNSYLNTIFKRN